MRQVRSFVRRGRVTLAQLHAFETAWPLFGLSSENGLCHFDTVFNRKAPRILEIGFGSGSSLLTFAKTHPEYDFIGIEMHKPGIGALLMNMQLEHINNIRVFYADAVDVLTHCIPDTSLEMIQIFFPDPWPKRKHHKRRLIQTSFVDLLVSKVNEKGCIHLATDWEDYAKDMMQVLSACSSLKNLAGEMQFADRSIQRPIQTKFELRGTKSGRKIWELQFAVIARRPKGAEAIQSV